MSRTRRILRRVLIGAAALAGLVVLFVAFLVATNPGAKLALSVLNGRDLPFRAGSIQGSLAGSFVLHDVDLSLPPIEAALDTVTVEWDPLALLNHRVVFGKLSVVGGHVLVHPAAADSAQIAAAPAAADTTSGAPWTVQAKRLRIHHVSLDIPASDVHLRDVDVIGEGGPDEYRADVHASGSLWKLTDVDAFVRASGNTDAATADTLHVRALGGEVRGNAFVRWAPGLSWRARIAGDSLRAVELLPPTKERLGPVSFRVASTGVLHGDTTRVGLDVDALEGTLRDRPFGARGRVDLDGRRISASDARIEWGRARVELSGSVEDNAADVTLDAVVPALEEILPQARGAVSVRGKVAGSKERLNVDVDVTGRNVRTANVDLPDLDASVDATATAEKYVPQAVDIHRATVRAAGGRIDARGTASWKNGIVWDGVVSTDSIEISAVTPPRLKLYGPVSIDASTQGRQAGRHLRGAVSVDSLSGSLRDRALEGSGAVAINGGEFDFSELRLQWGDTRVRADGHFGDRLDLRVELDAPDLAAIDTSLAGALALDGSASGPRHKPRVIADITADSVRVQTYAARRLEGHIDADLALTEPADVRLVAVGVARGKTAMDSVRVGISGPRDDQRAQFYVAMDSTRVELALRGALGERDWRGAIEELRIEQPAAGKWELRDRAPLYLSRSRISADSLALVSGKATLSLHGAWQQHDSTHAEAALANYPLSNFEKYFAEGIRVTGTASANASITIDPRGWITARVDAAPGPGEIVMGDRRVAYTASATGRAGAHGVSARLDIDMTRNGDALATVDATMAIPDFVPGRDSLGTQTVQGSVDVDCRNIAPLMAVFAPSLTEASGALTAHMKPAGTADDFRLTGRIALEDGKINLPSGLRLRDTDITLVSDGDGKIVLDGGVTSGGGRVFIKATSARSEKAWLNGTFSVQGERFQVVNQPEARIFVSPDIEVAVSERVAHATGRVRVPYARIEVAEVPASAVSPSDDVVIVEDTLSTRPAWQVKTDVRVELGDSVTFAGFGLQARLAGNLAVHDERGQPTRGTGEIRITEGKYRAYGNELRIDQGRFVFGGGAIDNPGLDVRAYRNLSTQTNLATSGEEVGVHLRGTLKEPEVTLFSNPPMSQSEIMSYLVLGRPLDATGDQSALASAALLVGLQQGTGVAGDIGKALSLDEAYIEGGSNMKETSFVAGKYLSPKLYVSYATGLFEKTNTFRVRYSLTRKWTLQGESGKENSTDLLYWFERGK